MCGGGGRPSLGPGPCVGWVPAAPFLALLCPGFSPLPSPEGLAQAPGPVPENCVQGRLPRPSSSPAACRSQLYPQVCDLPRGWQTPTHPWAMGGIHLRLMVGKTVTGGMKVRCRAVEGARSHRECGRAGSSRCAPSQGPRPPHWPPWGGRGLQASLAQPREPGRTLLL